MIELQLENISTCSARCHFCVYPTVKERWGNTMSMDLFRKIIDDAATIPQFTLVKLVGLGEPTLDRHLSERISYVHEKMAPYVRVETYTHGIHLTPVMFENLKAAGLNSLVVSLNAVRGEQHDRIMGTKGKFKTVCDHLEYAIAHRGDMHVETHAVVNGDYFTDDDAIQFIMRWGDRSAGGFGCVIHEGNWAGDNRTVHSFKPNECCFRATTQIYVMWDGRISTCCFDPTGKQIFGDLSKQTLRECYNVDPWLSFREAHSRDEADRYEICKGCTRI